MFNVTSKTLFPLIRKRSETSPQCALYMYPAHHANFVCDAMNHEPFLADSSEFQTPAVLVISNESPARSSMDRLTELSLTMISPSPFTSHIHLLLLPSVPASSPASPATARKHCKASALQPARFSRRDFRKPHNRHIHRACSFSVFRRPQIRVSSSFPFHVIRFWQGLGRQRLRGYAGTYKSKRGKRTDTMLHTLFKGLEDFTLDGSNPL